jgi:exodeoxyribonuclease V beta subunit
VTALDPLGLPLAGTALIEASAGTGKTYTLATLYLRLLLEQRLQVGQILVVTYTNAATAELRDRIRRRLREALAVFAHLDRTGEPPADAGSDRAPLVALAEASRRAGTLAADQAHLAAALRGFDEAAIFTIHGFCQRILLENAFESGVPFDAELVTEEGPLCREMVQDFWLRTLYDAPAAFVRRAYDAGLVPDRLEQLARRVLTHRDMEVLPEGARPPSAQEIARLTAEHRAARGAAAEIWTRARAEIEPLVDPRHLNRTSYPEDKIAAWCAELDDWLMRPSGPAFAPFARIEKFAASHLAAKTKRDGVTPRHAFFAACERIHAAQQAIEGEYREFELWLQRELVRYVRGEVAARHERANTQSFDDLLYRLRDALRAPSTGDVLADRIRERFRAALIDEFQDTDPVQYEIFRTVYGGRAPLLLIGDPKQAIYGFRGADVFTYVAAKAGAQAHTLDTNHRSAPGLVVAVNTLFKRARDPFVFAEIPFHEVRPAPGKAASLEGPLASAPPLEVLFLRHDKPAKATSKDPFERHVPGVVANEVVRLLQSGTSVGGRPLHAGDVAVLCRANWQAVAMQEELRRHGVPSVLHGDDSVFESPEAEEIERVLRAVAEPADPGLVRAALATRLVGFDAPALAALQADETTWDRWAARFREWLDVWTEQGFMAAFRRLLDACETQRRLLSLEDGERRLTNVLHVAELLQTAAREAHRGPLALVDWLSLMRHDAAARVEVAKEAAQIRLESDERAVQLVTIHRSKGLEYGVVYCPFAWHGGDLHTTERSWVKYHDPDERLALKLDLGSSEREAHLDRAKLEDFAENLRLLYVAMTRAKHRCSLVWACAPSAKHAPLGYLLHQVPGPTAEATVGATKERIRQLDEDAMLADLRRLAEESSGSIGVRELPLPDAAIPRLLHAAAGEDAGGLAGPREARRTLDAVWRTSSFSRLAASGGRTSHGAEEGIDRDEGTAIAHGELAPGRAPRGATPVVLHGLRAGARTGELLHWILEQLDFTREGTDELVARVREGLARFACDAAYEPVLVRGIADALATPLGGTAGSFALAALPRERRLDELPFLMPVRRGFDRNRLAACFERHPSPRLPADYAGRIRRLGFGMLEGFLAGFIDLVFEHGGRWYVVDYKSNFLGPQPDDYAPARLAREMSLHHYVLQYHLYVLALHRHLAARLPGYDYERHFGGVYYLFLRGMSPANPPSCGVFHDRPGAALVGELSALLGEPATGAAA